MPQGVIKWYSLAKGYGFIRPDDEPTSPDIFVHHSAFLDDERTVEDGDCVSYETETWEKGVRAVKVSRLPVEND